MTDDSDQSGGTRKSANINADGSYKVGKNKPPEHGKFRKGDGRRRGRRKNGTRNFATDFTEELDSKITLKLDGKPRRVTRQRAIVMRLMDNASRGQNAAIKTIMAYAERFDIRLEAALEPTGKNYPHLKDLSAEELDLLGSLLEKASGVIFEMPILPENPFAYLKDAEDPRNYIDERTVEGINLRRCLSEEFCDRIERIDSRAYFSAALPCKVGCLRDHM